MTDYLRAVCHAIRDRHDAEMIRCFVCGLFWETRDPAPPACRARQARQHNYDKVAFTAEP